ncbi:M48 family metallopeptidase [Alistipes indistinctus]|uniref:M48 family metallopeptidase n=1 Tax=Alistipes indistinctus TaxID=626932 RepID=UPI00259B9A6D|nr:M48 family metallopeptidase [Alistipes indistinctus]
MIKILIIALVIYLLVVTRARIRLPHPGLQATVDVLKAADLSDDEVQRMAAQYVRYCDAQNRVAPAGDPYAERLARLTGRYVAVNGIPLNFKVYKTTAVNAFATADGSIRVFSGLMDRLGDDELMAIVGHEMGHVRNHDTIGAMRKAYLASAARNALGAVGGALGALSASQLGSIAEQYASAQFSQGQETLADDFSFGFLIRNGYDPYAMASALEKITQISRQGGSEADEVMQLFSTHPDSAWRAARMRSKADRHLGRRSGA